jgi:hypothetical protein
VGSSAGAGHQKKFSKEAQNYSNAAVTNTPRDNLELAWRLNQVGAIENLPWMLNLGLGLPSLGLSGPESFAVTTKIYIENCKRISHVASTKGLGSSLSVPEICSSWCYLAYLEPSTSVLQL